MKVTKTKLLSIVDRFSGKKIAVWGDFILDEFLYGNTSRISREAPVLILSYKRREFYLGGGGNALLNLKALGAEAIPIGFVGRDSAGDKILELTKKNNISQDFLFAENSYSTPSKTRILAGEETTRKQQILRIDEGGKVPYTPLLEQKIQKTLYTVCEKSDALIVSDYDYFNVSVNIYNNLWPWFQKQGLLVSLDSRFRIMDFKGATVSTPNESEVEEALRIKLSEESQQIADVGESLLRVSESKAVLLTRGSQGMILYEKGASPLIIPAHGPTDIVDVTGAGDTVISTLTLALASGATLIEAAHLANLAGSIVVMKKGPAILTTQELKEAIVS